MRAPSPSNVKAVLGPTNTGKTHLAIERLCGHSSGMIGFPLRLLAREVYDRLVAIKGPKEVGLITGEEKIMPAKARWLSCTAESMPRDRELAFAALDEAQLGATEERGHIFTDRMLNVRGREETMILGSEALRPVVRHLVPEAEIIGRPRFSTLSYAGARKLSRLPKRSVVVAFSAEEVYAIAEMIRRARGGAAVVMGALSPSTRNAQVAMYQAGEVDYLVATDAIGMGLNMDVAHVAFASLNKFDGRRQRRLSVAEMAQIAGRSGRHQRDGTFGSLGAEAGPAAFLPEEIEAIEGHRFPRLEALYWRTGDPDLTSIDGLIRSLEARPADAMLRAAPEALDLAILKRVADDPVVQRRALDARQVARLWEASGLPDFRKVGVEHHARIVARIYSYLSEGVGQIPVPWFASELTRLDRVDGDIDTLGGRIAAVRTWSYIAQRPDWLADPAHWAAQARQVEEKLSDALHARLTERFVDRRTTVLMRGIAEDPALLDVKVGDDGTVTVEDEPIGRLSGFRFSIDVDARTGDRKWLVAAAERHLVRERVRRAAALVHAVDADFELSDTQPVICWSGAVVARLRAGRDRLHPRVVLDPALDALTATDRERVADRIETWLRAMSRTTLAPLFAMARTAGDMFTPSRVRALLAPLAAGGGCVAREQVASALAALDASDRQILRKAGLTIGSLDVFDAHLLKPAPMRLIALLTAVAAETGSFRDAEAVVGFRRFGSSLVRIDLVERVARAAHKSRADSGRFTVDSRVAHSCGIDAQTYAAVLTALGFKPGAEGTWSWRGRPRTDRRSVKPPSAAFAALEGWRGG